MNKTLLAVLFSLLSTSALAQMPALTLNNWGQYATGIFYGTGSSLSSLTDDSSCFDNVWSAGDQVLKLASFHRTRSWFDDLVLLPLAAFRLAETVVMATTVCVLTDPVMLYWFPYFNVLESGNPNVATPMVAAPEFWDWINTAMVTLDMGLLIADYVAFFSGETLDWFFLGMGTIQTPFEFVQQIIRIVMLYP